MSGRQFVAIRFTPNAARTYTYHNDGPPLALGDRVKVDARGEGWQEVEVVEIVPEPPPFATKPVGPRASDALPADPPKGTYFADEDPRDLFASLGLPDEQDLADRDREA